MPQTTQRPVDTMSPAYGGKVASYQTGPIEDISSTSSIADWFPPVEAFGRGNVSLSCSRTTPLIGIFRNESTVARRERDGAACSRLEERETRLRPSVVSSGARDDWHGFLTATLTMLILVIGEGSIALGQEAVPLRDSSLEGHRERRRLFSRVHGTLTWSLTLTGPR
jgi:hypothetical protein